MVYYSDNSNNAISEHPWILIVAVVVGLLVCFCRMALATSDDDSTELPPVQIVQATSPEHVYPNHVIDMQQGYVAMAPTPSVSQGTPMIVEVVPATDPGPSLSQAVPLAVQVVPAYANDATAVSSQSTTTSA